jgi:phage-related minor tail protein
LSKPTTSEETTVTPEAAAQKDQVVQQYLSKFKQESAQNSAVASVLDRVHAQTSKIANMQPLNAPVTGNNEKSESNKLER